MASQLLHALLPVVILFAGIMGGASNQSRASSLDGHAPTRWWVDTWGHELSNPALDGAIAGHD
jgi:hypothetical protein